MKPKHRCILSYTLVLAVELLAGSAAAGPTDVLSSRYDAQRTGAALGETLLRPDAIDRDLDPDAFGKLFTYDLGALTGRAVGEIYAQPLYVRNISVPGKGVVNMLLVATMSNLVIALDADGPLPDRSVVLWQRQLGPAPSMDGSVWKNCEISHCLAPIGYNMRGTAGIGSTPVIDRQRGIVFLVDRVLTGQGIDVRYRLHALSLRDGRDLEGSPVSITGSSHGASFNPNWQNQRAGLAMSRGHILIGFGAYEDLLEYRGWVFSYRYDAGVGFAQSAVMTTTPDGDTSRTCAQPDLSFGAKAARAALHVAMATGDPVSVAAAQAAYELAAAPALARAANTCAHGGIWMAGRAPAIDAAGRVLLMVGNGRSDLGVAPNRNFGNALLALDPVTLTVLDSFTPSNHIVINAWDLDFGGSGPMKFRARTSSSAAASKASCTYGT